MLSTALSLSLLSTFLVVRDAFLGPRLWGKLDLSSTFALTLTLTLIIILCISL